MTLRVLGNRVLVRPFVQREELPAGLIAPETYSEIIPTTGVIVNVSPTCRHPEYPDAHDLVGRKVCFSPVSGQLVVFQGEELLILFVDDLLGVFEKES